MNLGGYMTQQNTAEKLSSASYHMPEWAVNFKRRTMRRSTESLERVKAQAAGAAEEVSRWAVRPGSWCIAVSVILAGMLFLIAVQYAGMVEIQYELNHQQLELSKLTKQKTEIARNVEELASLERIETEAVKMGMVYPSKLNVVKVSAPVASAGVPSDKLQ